MEDDIVEAAASELMAGMPRQGIADLLGIFTRVVSALMTACPQKSGRDLVYQAWLARIPIVGLLAKRNIRRAIREELALSGHPDLTEEILARVISKGAVADPARVEQVRLAVRERNRRRS